MRQWPTPSAKISRALGALETARGGNGTAYAVAYDRAAASADASDHGPNDDGRAFGACDAVDGVVVEERAGESTVTVVV